MPQSRPDGWVVFVTLLVIWIPTLLNLRGAVPVGQRLGGDRRAGPDLFWLCSALFALPNMTHSPWTTLGPAEPVRWSSLGAGLSLALWNWIGWDNASTVCGEIDDAGRTYPRALAIAVPLVAIGYFLPLLPALAASDWRTWREGGWPDIAREVAGPTRTGACDRAHRARDAQRDGDVQLAAACLLAHSAQRCAGSAAAALARGRR